MSSSSGGRPVYVQGRDVRTTDQATDSLPTPSTRRTTRKTAQGDSNKPPKKDREQQRAEKLAKQAAKHDKLVNRLPEGLWENRPQQKKFLLHWLYFWTYVRLGLYKITRVPPPRPALSELIMREDIKQFELRQTRRGEIGVFGLKGGVGKSTVVSIIAWYSAKLSFLPTLLMDSRNKPGDLADRLGIWVRGKALHVAAYTTITLRQALDLYTQGTFREATVTQTIIGSIYGVKLDIVAADTETAGPDLFVDVPTFDAMTDQFDAHYPLVFHECSDDLGHPLDLALMGRVDVPIFVHNTDMQSSAKNLITQLRTYCSQRGGSHEADIREHGHLVVLATRSKHTAAEFSQLTGGLIPPERVFLVPYSRYFRQDASEADHTSAHTGTPAAAPTPALNFAKMPKSAELPYKRLLNSATEHLGMIEVGPTSTFDLNSDRPVGMQYTITETPERS
jgi:MinD-like ATPase involved in chromosome partitioning or flagellar assembly